MKTIKIGNVIFYKVCEQPNKPQNDIWITHDGEYGLFRFYITKKRREWAICKNTKFNPNYSINPFSSLNEFSLERINDNPFGSLRSAMQYICERYYWESKN